jgi:hypothetical protein
MSTTQLSTDQLRDFAQKVGEVASKFPSEVVRIRFTFGRDWDGDPAVYFRILLTDGARSRYLLSQLTGLVGSSLIRELGLDDMEYIPHFSYRSKAEQDKLRDPEWE